MPIWLKKDNNKSKLCKSFSTTWVQTASRGSLTMIAAEKKRFILRPLKILFGDIKHLESDVLKPKNNIAYKL